MRTFKNRYKRFLNEGMSWEDKYEEVQRILKKDGWNDVSRMLDKHLRAIEDDDDFDTMEDLYCSALSLFDDSYLKRLSDIINK